LILLGLLALAAWTRRIEVVIGTLVVLILGVVVMRIWMLDNFPHAFQVYSRTDARADSLLIGALAAVLWTRYRLPRRVLALAASVAIVFLFVVVLTPLGPIHPFFYRGGFTLIALASAVVILAVVESDWWANRVFRFGPLCAIGVVSYGLYLWHVPVFLIVGRNTTEWPTLARVALGFVVAAAITAASWFLVERPFLRWKKRLERDRATRTDVDAADGQPPAEPEGQQTGPVAPAVDAAVR
jgi:peptidoglycan/LPS O-acetylase OafA/YrhL